MAVVISRHQCNHRRLRLFCAAGLLALLWSSGCGGACPEVALKSEPSPIGDMSLLITEARCEAPTSDIIHRIELVTASEKILVLEATRFDLATASLQWTSADTAVVILDCSSDDNCWAYEGVIFDGPSELPIPVKVRLSTRLQQEWPALAEEIPAQLR